MQLPDSGSAVLILIVLLAAVMGGAATAFVRLTDRNTAIDIGLWHGRLGVSGILLLLLSGYFGDVLSSQMQWVLGLLALTATVGVGLYFIIRRQGILPVKIIAIHASLAVSMLAVFLLGGSL